MTDDGQDANKKSILFNMTKRESHSPNSGFKKLARRLRGSYRIDSNKEDLSKEILSDIDLLVFGGARALFTKSEFEILKTWLSSGGRAMFLCGDGGEKQTSSNLNYFLEEFGIYANNDSVVRSSFYKYLHPKEVFIAEGVLVPDLARKKNDVTSGKKQAQQTKVSKSKNATVDKLPFVYPFGSSLNIQRPARPLLSSGPISYPMNRPIAGFWEAETSISGRQRGRLLVLGSVEMFSDDWLDKEENAKLCDLLFSWLLNDIELDMTSDRQDSDISENVPVPNIEALSQVIKPCLQGVDELPKDFTNLYDFKMFKFDFDMVPQVKNMYGILNVPHETLTLIPPQFECPLPKLSPAVFPPAMREPFPPALDQFDLDEQFAKEDIRLAQLTNKCTPGEEDMEYYIAEAGEILGIIHLLPFGERSAKHILYYAMKSIVDFKMSESGSQSSVTEVKGFEFDYSGRIGFGSKAPDYEYENDAPAIQATSIPIHVPRIDLAPIDSKLSHNFESSQSKLNSTFMDGKMPLRNDEKK